MPTVTPLPDRADRPNIELSVYLLSYMSEGEEARGWEKLRGDAQMLDQCGVDRLAVSDHVVFGEHLEEYGRPEIGGQAGGVQPTGPDGEWLEPLTALSYLGGMTRRVRLSTNILIAALRRPVILAKAVSTLDLLSGGRLDIGVGVGWQREEYEAAGLDFTGRGRVLDHCMEVCRTLWTETRAAYHSPELDFDAVHMMPKPFQKGGVPFWVSGTVNPRVVRRVAEFGSGWIPWGDAAADVTMGIVKMKEGLAALGRDADRLQVVGSLRMVRTHDGALDVGRTMEAVPLLLAAGVTDARLRVILPEDRSAARDQLVEIVTAFRAAAGRADPIA